MNTHKRLDIYSDFANNLWEEPRDLEPKETAQCNTAYTSITTCTATSTAYFTMMTDYYS